MIFSHVLYQLSYPATGSWLGPAPWHRGDPEDRGGSDGTRTRDLRRDRPAF